MMEKSRKEFIRKHRVEIDTWSEFARLELERGSLLEEVRQTLLQNNISQEVAELIVDPGTLRIANRRSAKSTALFITGILQLIVGVGFIVIGVIAGGISLMGLLFLGGGVATLVLAQRAKYD